MTLNNGVEMPILGFGVFQVPGAEIERVVTDALAAGYRHLDTAAAYGNEGAVGRAIKASGIARDKLFVTTEPWIHSGGEEGAKRAFDASLQALGLDHLGLYLIHQPLGDCYSSWRAMQDLHRQGAIRAIGVSNFHPGRLVDLLEHNETTPAVNQIKTHPYHQRTTDQQVMTEHGVQIEAWGPLAEGKTASSATRSSPPSARPTAGRSPKSPCAGSSSAASSSSPSSPAPSAWPRTSTSSTSSSPPTRWRPSPPWRRCQRHLRPPRPRHGQLARQPPGRLMITLIRAAVDDGVTFFHTPHADGPFGLGSRPAP